MSGTINSSLSKPRVLESRGFPSRPDNNDKRHYATFNPRQSGR